jgi:hypothetical protein
MDSALRMVIPGLLRILDIAKFFQPAGVELPHLNTSIYRSLIEICFLCEVWNNVEHFSKNKTAEQKITVTLLEFYLIEKK